MNQNLVNPIVTQDFSKAKMTALCFMARNGFNYLLGGSLHGRFIIYDMLIRKILCDVMFENSILQIYHHLTEKFEIIVREFHGRISFWSLDENCQMVLFHSEKADAEIPRTIIADHYILFPQSKFIQICDLKDMQGPKKKLCELSKSQFANLTDLLSIKISDTDWYVVCGYSNGSLIIREPKPYGSCTEMDNACSSAICCMTYNKKNQELVISCSGSIELNVIRIDKFYGGRLTLTSRPQILVGYTSSIATIDSRSAYLFCSQNCSIKAFNLKTPTPTCHPISPPKLNHTILCITTSSSKLLGWCNMYVCAVAYDNGDICFWLLE